MHDPDPRHIRPLAEPGSIGRARVFPSLFPSLPFLTLTLASALATHASTPTVASYCEPTMRMSRSPGLSLVAATTICPPPGAAAAPAPAGPGVVSMPPTLERRR